MIALSTQVVPFCIFLQSLLAYVNLPSYSMFNFMFFWLSAIVFKPFLPVAVCSSVATCASFYSTIIIDIGAVNALRLKYNYSIPFFMFGDFVIHAMPLLFVYFKYWREAIEIITRSKNNNQALIGLSSIFIHLVWLQFNSNMNHTYVKLSQKSWLILWNVAILSHLVTMNMLYISSNTL